MSAKDVIEQMSSGNVHRPALYKVTVKEGAQVTEIAETVANELKWNKDDVVRQLNDKAFIQKMQQKYPKLLTDKIFDSNIKYPLEGYLYPATYSFYKKDTTLEEIVIQMLEKNECNYCSKRSKNESEKLGCASAFNIVFTY